MLRSAYIKLDFVYEETITRDFPTDGKFYGSTTHRGMRLTKTKKYKN